MSAFTLTHGTLAAPRLTLHGLWHGLCARFAGFPAFSPAAAPQGAGPLGQAESALYARGYLGWRG
ncbi:MAG: hypothetical protein WD489_02545 [Rhodovibrionaceae bacterium]